MTCMTIEEVKRKHERQLLSLPGIVSVGIGLNKQNVKVISIGIGTAESRPDSIPSKIEGYEVVVQITGVIRAQTKTENGENPKNF